MSGEVLDAHRLDRLIGSGRAGGGSVIQRPVQLAGHVARALGEAGQPGQ
ncbi:hypothetical protein [Nonomuraea dietziae]